MGTKNIIHDSRWSKSWEAEKLPMKEKVIERGYEIADAAKDLEAFYEYLAG